MPNRGGRPRVPGRGKQISTYVRPHDHDRIIAIAMRTGLSVSAVMRRLLIRKLREAPIEKIEKP